MPSNTETSPADVTTDGGQTSWSAPSPETEPETCQSCGCEVDTANSDLFVDTDDVGPDADGGTAELFRMDVEEAGNEWLGFEEEDIGAWCHYCSWELQAKRSK